MSAMGELNFFLGLQTIVATSTTEAEYVATASCYGQVLWIQNQLLDYGVDHIHTDENVADLLTKPFDAGRFQYLVVKHVMKGFVNGDPHLYTLFEEGIDYDEVFAPVARIETVRLFLAYASFMGFTVYQMDVKSAFLYGTIDEEVYVMQPPRFQDPEFLARVYKVEKAMGTIDQNLFIRSHRGDFILIQVYVDDIIFGSSNPQLCREFKALMHEKFQMSDMGELNFFLGLQVLQKEDGIFLSQDKLSMPCEALSKEISSSILLFQIVDFVEASHIRYALTFNPTVHVSHIRQFWSTARIETMEEGTKILATVDGKLRTIFESSIRRNLKLNDEAGISSLSDAELFENLTLMRYNISQNQKFTFQKGQFSHQWKYLIHTIMQCLSPKNTGFNEFSSNIAIALVCLATNRVYNFSKMIFDGLSPYFPPCGLLWVKAQALQLSPITHPLMRQHHHHNMNSHHHHFYLLQLNHFPLLHHLITPPLRQYTRRARIAQSSVLPPVADEPASPIGDDSQGKACPTDSGLEADQDRVNIAKTSSLPSDSTPRVTSFVANEGSMQQKLDELMDLCTSLQRQQLEMISKFAAQELEINRLKAIIKLLEDKDRGVAEQSKDDAPIKERRMDEGEEAAERVKVATATVSIPIGSGVVSTASPTIPTASPIFTTATESTPYKKKRNNETIAKYLQEYYQFATELPIERRIELISDLVKYQEHYAKILKYQTQQRKPLSRKQQKELYMSVLKSHAGWKARHFKGITLEEIKEKFDPVWKQFQDFIPIGSKEEAERFKKKVEEVYVVALQVKHPIIDWEVHTEGERIYWKIVRLGGGASIFILRLPN
nr:copia protein [Tanacetum cinerariifolium]